MTQHPELDQALQAEAQWAAEDHWLGAINQRLNHATSLLNPISSSIETVDPDRREHAADLLDTVIDALQRLHDRFGPPQRDDDPDDPPF